VVESNVEEKVSALLRLIDERGNPNINELWRIAKDIEGIKLNIKFFGYELARQLAASLPPRAAANPGRVGLKSKPSTQADMEGPWVAYWAQRLKIPVVFHRKIWELTYALQALNERGMLLLGRRGLGFGCGEEPLPSLMTAMGVDVTITDLAPREAMQRGWAATNQHTSAIEKCFRPELVDLQTFKSRARLEYADMNAIPEHLVGYDFCWSICSLEHLGSIEKGLDFIVNSLTTLKSGGVAVHTTEFNFLRDDETLDNWPTVLFQRGHFEAVAQRLRGAGHTVAPLDFDIGNKPMDHFLDLPPFETDYDGLALQYWRMGAPHLKLMIDGFASTCFGLIIQKA
jgi:hypothetical protein